MILEGHYANGSCPNCGGKMVGDGYSTVLHCEFSEPTDEEPDAQPVLCKENEKNQNVT